MSNPNQSECDDRAKEKTRVVDSTRKVVIGPVAQRLALRSSTKPAPLAHRLSALALLAGCMTCCFIVNAVVQRGDRNNIWQTIVRSAEIPQNLVSTSVGSPKEVLQVRSVMQLGEAFAALDSQDVAISGPLKLETPPTTPIAVYTRNEETSLKTAQFIQQLGFSEDSEQGTEIVASIEENAYIEGNRESVDDSTPVAKPVTNPIDELVDETVVESAESQVRSAIANYGRALEKLRASKSNNRAVARVYYAAAASICELAHQTDVPDKSILELFDGVSADKELRQLVSSAARSWIRWSKRASTGVLIAGQHIVTTESDNGPELKIQTTDEVKTIIPVVVPHPHSVAEGDYVVILGKIDSTNLDQIVIRGIIQPSNTD